MSNLPHRRLSANAALFAGLLALPACTVGPWQSEFWNPPAATGVAPIESGKSYPITRAGGSEAAWPNLADVPARQDAPLTAEQVAGEQANLEADRARAGQPAAASRLQPAGQSKEPPQIPPEVTEE